MKIKAFYMRPDPARPDVALGCDLIAPDGYGEMIGGGERSSDLAHLERRIEEEKLPKAAYEWYLDLRRYGACPSAGFGLGLERTVAWICGLDHAREAAAFPRTLHRVYP
jgi:asparaginyl-tRNA synthetase